MITTDIIAVLACWLIAVCGVAMLVRATSWLGLASANCAVAMPLLLLSAMVLSNERPKRDGPFYGEIDKGTYHAAGCPDMRHPDVVFRSSDEATWCHRKACTRCLLHYAAYYPGDS